MSNTLPKRYSAPSIALHWLIALLIFAGFGLGQFMTGLEMSPGKLELYGWHKWIGVSVFLLAVLRVLWRIGNPPPALPEGMPVWQRLAAAGGHLALYVLMFAIPLSGWLMSSANGYQTVYFGVLPLPDLLGKNLALAGQLKFVHVALCNVLFLVLIAHIGAAIWHQYADKDGVLERMAPKFNGATPLAAVFGIVAMIGLAAVSFGGEEHEEEAPAQQASADVPDAATTPAGELTIGFEQMGIGVDAQFTRYSVDLRFDAQALADSSIAVRVAVDSFDIGDDSYNSEITGSAWLDAAQFPEATFVSERIEAQADGSGFVAYGPFTLKGATQPEEIPFHIEDDGAVRRYIGAFDISRGAFGVGDADWDDSVADTVKISFVVEQAP